MTAQFYPSNMAKGLSGQYSGTYRYSPPTAGSMSVSRPGTGPAPKAGAVSLRVQTPKKSSSRSDDESGR